MLQEIAGVLQNPEVVDALVSAVRIEDVYSALN
jgi:mannitol/fructose-specific phosphotransferase system IIA component (Ntr-type)